MPKWMWYRAGGCEGKDSMLYRQPELPQDVNFARCILLQYSDIILKRLLLWFLVFGRSQEVQLCWEGWQG